MTFYFSLKRGLNSEAVSNLLIFPSSGPEIGYIDNQAGYNSKRDSPSQAVYSHVCVFR
jgi:hypothetical protein